jgi:hypothetical protein
MGAIARNIANKITTSGVFTSGAITNSSVTGITVLANASDGITLISSQTASNSASLSFTTGIDSTYKAYKFVFSSIKVATNNEEFGFLTSTDGGSNYGVTTTNSVFFPYHLESDGAALLSTTGGADYDLAQSTSLNNLSLVQGNNSDDSYSGTMTLFNPSSTTYVKHFIAVGNNAYDTTAPISINNYLSGYVNTTSAVNAIQFKASAGNITGTVYMYGIK